MIEVIESRSIVIRIVCLPSQRSPRESNLSDSWVYYFIILLLFYYYIIILLFFYYYYYLKDALFLPSLIYWDA